MIILKKNKLIEVKIEDLTLKIKPLSYAEKMEIQKHLVNKDDIGCMMKAAYEAVSYSLKDIQGIKDEEGMDYKLIIEDDRVHPDCMDELLNAYFAPKLSAVCASLLNGVPKGQILDAYTGKPMEGVELVLPGKK